MTFRCAGCPYTATRSYLLRLIGKGFRVAVCEQVGGPGEEARKRGSKAVVERQVTRVVRTITAGTLTEDDPARFAAL